MEPIATPLKNLTILKARRKTELKKIATSQCVTNLCQGNAYLQSENKGPPQE